MGSSISSYSGNGSTEEQAILALSYNLIIDKGVVVSRCGWFSVDGFESNEFFPAIFVVDYGWYFVNFTQFKRGIKATIVYHVAEHKNFRTGDFYNFDTNKWLRTTEI